MNPWVRHVVEVGVCAAVLPVRATGGVWRLGTRLGCLVRLRAYARGRVPVTTQFDGPVRCCPGGRLVLGEHCRLGREVYFETSGEGRIEIGRNVRINTGTLVASQASIVIGDDVLIGEYVSIRDANHGIVSPGEPIRQQPHMAKPIRIGHDVWIGRGSVVLPGVEIGDGAVIGANSVVTRDIPPQAIAVGAPASVLRSRIADAPDPTHAREAATGESVRPNPSASPVPPPAAPAPPPRGGSEEEAHA